MAESLSPMIMPTPDAYSDPEQTDVLLSGTPLDEAAADFGALLNRPPEPPPEPIPLPEQIGRYRVLREIARGGMGVIVAAFDSLLVREVAIKVMLPNHLGKPGYRERFVQEARITGMLQHPGVSCVYDLGELPDTLPYFAMKLVDGQTLDEHLTARKHPTDNLPHFLQVFEHICQALAYAHSKGVIHRDLKPLNIMVAPFGVVKIMDWGVACAKGNKAISGASCSGPPLVPSPSPSLPEDVIGTPAYMSPEQAQGGGQPTDERTDVFGLGGILCAILTGHPPYTGTRARKVHARAAKADLTECFARLDASPAARELVALAKRCLSAHPAARPRDAQEVLAALTAYIESDLRRAERDLVRFFELSPDLLCIAGLDGYFRRINENFSRVLGYTTQELLSRPFVDFVHPDDRERTAAEAEKLTHGLPVVRFRNRYRDVHGEYHWFEWEAKSIPEEKVVFAVARVS